MATLSELNKKERDVKGRINTLKRRMRKNKVTREEFDRTLELHGKELDKISDEKEKLIGLPPMPLPPKPGRHASDTSLNDIKKVVSGIGIEPPGPPVLLEPRKQKRFKIPKSPKRARLPKLKNLPKLKKLSRLPEPPKHTKSTIEKKHKEVKTIVKEKIKEINVPVIKEIKVPVIKTVKVPRDDPKMASRIESLFRDMSNLKIDVARQDKDFSQMSTDIKNMQVDLTRSEREVSGFLKDIGKNTEKLVKLKELEADVKELGSKLNKIDFKGLSQEIYTQFDKMNQGINESDKKIDDVIEKLNVEVNALKEQMKDVNTSKEHVEKLDIPNIRRDMEVLKQKSQYLEKHFESIDFQPIVDMVKDVENKVMGLQSSSALIIE